MAKVKNTLWEMVKRKGKVDGPFLKDAARIAFTECGACRRCSMYCPFGIDIAYQIMTVRRICNLLGIVPQYLQDTTNSHSVASNQMWVQQDDWIDTLMWQEEDAMAELPGARIPLDKEGADVMYSVIAPEPKILAQLIGNMAIIMKVAGIDWTMPSADGWDKQQHGHVFGRLRGHGPRWNGRIGSERPSCESKGSSWVSAATPTAARCTTDPSGWRGRSRPFP